ncbi:MAG: glycoside hydrolase family 3 C-terminal domain-containing protein, partial [Ignavibacteria bacterium]
ILPLNLSKLKSIAVIGPTSNVAITGGGGSSMVTPFYSISPLEAIKNKVGNKIKINFAQGIRLNGSIEPIKSEFLFVDAKGKQNGLKGEYFPNTNLEGLPSNIRIDIVINFNWQWEGPFEKFPQDHFSVRWSGYLKVDKTNQYTIDVSSDDGVRLYFNDKLVIDDWNDHAELTNSFTTKLEANKFYKIRLEFYENSGAAICRLGLRETDTTMFTKAINTAKNSDVALVFAGTNYTYESEGFDRKNLYLPENQDELIKAIADVNKNTIVILTTGSPVLMNQWIDSVPVILESWFGGEQIGNAIAEILIGETNPSGKLPITFPFKWEDCSSFTTYMKEDSISRYDDGIFIGYRHFDKNNIKPLFPFGFGLSYTTFEFNNLRTYKDSIKLNEKIMLSFTLKNTGLLSGKEVAQLYIKPLNTKTERAIKELKRFQKVNLESGEEKIITFILSDDDFKYYDENKKEWTLEAGEYEILIGSSSEDIKLRTKIVIHK